MKLNIKNYKIIKVENYIKNNNLLFFIDAINQHALEYLFVKQELKTIGFNYFKVSNKTTAKTLTNSIYTKISPVFKGSTFFFKASKNKLFLKKTAKNTFNSLLFKLLIFKFNNKIYSIKNIFKNINSVNYKETKLILYKFNLIYIKIYSKFSK